MTYFIDFIKGPLGEPWSQHEAPDFVLPGVKVWEVTLEIGRLEYRIEISLSE